MRARSGGVVKRSVLGGALGVAGLIATALAVLDPARTRLAGVGLALALLGVVAGVGVWRRVLGLTALLTAAWALAAYTRPEFRADAGNHFVYLRSLAFDRDLDFTNDWQGLDRPVPPRTATGLPSNTHSVGPALLWTPFFAAAHGYVTLTHAAGSEAYSADGFSAPYRRAPILGTVLGVWAGALLLLRLLEAWHGRGGAVLAVAAAIATSPILYYTLVVPAMAHGLTFATGAALLWACDRARRKPSARAWLAVGALLGLAVLVRWQAAVYVLLVVPLGLLEWRRQAARPVWLLGAGGLSFLCLIPQLVAWRVLFGRVGGVPQGAGYMDWTSPHLQDVLFSANHGLFTWTPAALLAVLGLALGVRERPLFHGAGLAIFAATAWVNGSVTDWDWEGGDAFGARRFDLVVPFFALGLGSLISASTALVARRPLLAPAALLGVLVLWNVGFIAAFRQERYPETAPFRTVATDQARRLDQEIRQLAERLGGVRGRAFAYRSLSAEYLDAGAGAVLDPPSADEALLLHGWSTRANRMEVPPFRWALHPEACVLVALGAPAALSVEILVRAPRRALPQSMDAGLNGVIVANVELGQEWTTHTFVVPAEATHGGENRLCLRFSNGTPGDDGQRVGAAVSRIRLAVCPGG